MFKSIIKKLMKFFRRLKNNHGNSLAEFAVVTAMMGTLASTDQKRIRFWHQPTGRRGPCCSSSQGQDRPGLH